jgi:hypothetical protein
MTEEGPSTCLQIRNVHIIILHNITQEWHNKIRKHIPNVLLYQF